jgi:apolipoprotein N-acyltransferase
LLMCIPLMLFFEAGKILPRALTYLTFIFFWMSFEYIHLNWQLSWPWLTLGNGFALHPDWVQWYEFTGTSGGSFWILVTNVLLFEALRKGSTESVKAGRLTLTFAIVCISLPLMISIFIKRTIVTDSGDKNEVVILQPNIDPYTKFAQGSQAEQLELLISLSDSAITERTRLVIWPETAINGSSTINFDQLSSDAFLDPLRVFLNRHPRIQLLSGIEGVRFFTENNKDQYSRRTRTEGLYYDMYNAAGLFDSAGSRMLYTKSKLVPGVETLPSFLKFMDALFEQFGGTTGGYAMQAERTVMQSPESRFKIAPAICYESIYGEFLTEYIANGANLIVIITNDGWWANTSGHKQHMQYARLRAIETRRWVARSANTGISCIISPVGDINHPRPWDTRSAIRMSIPVLSELTFFVKHGDILSHFAMGVACVMLLQIIYLRLSRTFKKH